MYPTLMPCFVQPLPSSPEANKTVADLLNRDLAPDSPMYKDAIVASEWVASTKLEMAVPTKQSTEQTGNSVWKRDAMFCEVLHE
jgi:hypothetical protein